MNTLTQKQINFCNLYIELGNASQAYKEAFIGNNMNNKTINEEASRLLNTPKISTRVKELQKEAQKRSNISIDKVVKELVAIGFADITKVFKEDGTIKLPHELDEDIRKSIKKIRLGEVVEYEFHDKAKGLDMLMKHLGGYSKDNKQKQIKIPTHKELYGE